MDYAMVYGMVYAIYKAYANSMAWCMHMHSLCHVIGMYYAYVTWHTLCYMPHVTKCY